MYRPNGPRAVAPQYKPVGQQTLVQPMYRPTGPRAVAPQYKPVGQQIQTTVQSPTQPSKDDILDDVLTYEDIRAIQDIDKMSFSKMFNPLYLNTSSLISDTDKRRNVYRYKKAIEEYNNTHRST